MADAGVVRPEISGGATPATNGIEKCKEFKLDPFLVAHQWDGLPIFDLSSRLSTIAIRDQMVRALMLADVLPKWLDKEPIKASEEYPILVIGGGACGMSVAVALAHKQLNVSVIEAFSEPFGVQSGCESRWLDPTQYDWLMDHWRWACFPPKDSFNNEKTPFDWTADRANSIARKWNERLVDYHLPKVKQFLTFYGSTKLIPHKEDKPPVFFTMIEEGMIEVRVKSSNKIQRMKGKAVVLAPGFGNEKTDVISAHQPTKKFQGPPFWGTDKFEHENSGLPDGQAIDQAIDKVLLCGSGDGALQDFLRLLTRKASAREIFEILKLEDTNFSFAAIHSAEHRTERALNWSPNRDFARPYMQALHKVHSDVAEAALKQISGLLERIQDLVKKKPLTTILVHPQNYFTCTYALNRFLALLLIKAIAQMEANVADENKSVRVINDWEVVDIDGDYPECEQTTDYWQTCFGRSWNVRLRDRNNKKENIVNANIIIIRFGLDSPEVTGEAGSKLRGMPRPVPPAYLLWPS